MLPKALALGLALIWTSWAATARADALEVVKKAVAAHGGAEQLNFCGRTVTATGTIKIGGAAAKYDLTSKVMRPDKMRNEFDLTIDDESIKVLQVVNGKQGWEKIGDMKTAMASEAYLTAVRKQLQVDEAALLAPLFDKKKYTVEQLFGEFKVKGKKTIAVNVKNKNGLDVTFHFDLKTHLLVKQEFSTMHPINGDDVLQETFASDYKKTDGLMMPRHFEIHFDGEPFFTATIDQVHLHAQLDANLFAKPE